MYILFQIVLGFVLLIFGGEVLVRGATQLALCLRIPPLVVGLTVIAFCTSAPELAVSVQATRVNEAGLAIGNIIGSNIANICLILGCAAVIAPLSVSTKLVRREIPFMIGISLLLFVVAMNGQLLQLFSPEMQSGFFSRFWGLFFVLGLIAYMIWTVYEVIVNRSQSKAIADEMELETMNLGKGTGFKTVLFALLGIMIGLALLLFGSDTLISGSVALAQILGVPSFIIGLTILAVGTSLPELVVSVVAAIKGKTDLAIGNVIGSNIFNILGVLGISALCSPEKGLPVPVNALRFDMPVLLLASFLCIVICVTDLKVSRKEGLFLLVCYFGYIAYNISV
ncbi:MAG: calcium/sodium antiporter [Thermoguttaceae bacterium]